MLLPTHTPASSADTDQGATQMEMANEMAELATAIKYAATLKSFGPEFEVAGPALGDRYRYADSLAWLGKLERRIVNLRDQRGEVCGNRIEFRAALAKVTP